MKKSRGFIFSLAIIFTVSAGATAFGNSQVNDFEKLEIDGLQDKIDALCLKKAVDEITQNRMYQQRLDAFNAGWPEWLETTKMLGKMEGKTDEEMYDYHRSLVEPELENGFLISLLNTNKYMMQYAKSRNLSYLFSSLQYWMTREGGKFLKDGTYFAYPKNVFGTDITRFGITQNTIDFVNDSSALKALLLAKGETLVSDVKLFAPVDLLTFLYVRCDKNEYLVKIDDLIGTEGYVSQIELLKLYPALEVMEAIASVLDDEKFSYNPRLAENILVYKPTYESEAESLHQQGLLNGNENGLDLLKPLTRIEAAAMLLRALGQSETANSGSGQIFSDVPQDHWGYGAAENAYNLGLIRGVGNNQFAPDNNVTAAEFSTMVLRASGAAEFNWEQALSLLIEQNIITQDNANTMDFFTRGDMAKIIYEAKAKDFL